MRLLNDRMPIGQNKIKHKATFDLNEKYTVSFISRLLKISEKMALRYVDEQGNLTDRGVETLLNLNKELES